MVVHGLQGILKDVELLQTITEACREAVRAFVNRRTNKAGRVTTETLTDGFMRFAGLGAEPWAKPLQVRCHDDMTIMQICLTSPLGHARWGGGGGEGKLTTGTQLYQADVPSGEACRRDHVCPLVQPASTLVAREAWLACRQNRFIQKWLLLCLCSTSRQSFARPCSVHTVCSARSSFLDL